MRSLPVLLLALAYNFTVFAQTKISKISTEMEVQSIFNGQSVLTKGVVYFDLLNIRTVTSLHHPVKLVSVQEKSGDVFSYDPKNNVALQKKSQVSISSENVFRYLLMQNQGDLGLKERGFRLKSSKFNEGLVILTWEPPTMLASKIAYAELVTQNNAPIYLANFDNKNKIINKTYYTKYQNVAGFVLPMQITDFQYIYTEKNKKDSILTKTKFLNLKLNNEIDAYMLNFKIPSNAKIILE